MNVSYTMCGELVEPPMSTDPSASSGTECVHLIHTASINPSEH